ncbi:hypothetical protein [Halioxenophilus sp. WMMB6]|uniref:hypothetical protein n=1 Tax=Halioxenophilus sp. WMMB6 TaxID=3073815 RepID=UPI00295F1027|nr:hypothetical protein [Halioxenophilus sp. WMMB6]
MPFSLETPVASVSGFRRRFSIEPDELSIRVAVEDDFHCMKLFIEHKDGVAQTVTAEIIRAPWTTCPGAQQKATETFIGQSLTDFDRLGSKKQNCTHLYDLALLAGNHYIAASSFIYDILISDPDETGLSLGEVHRDGELLLRWHVRSFVVELPEEAMKGRLDRLTPWIESLESELKEPAKLLRWAFMIAHGRTIPMADQSDATAMPPNCYTFQPERAVTAVRIGEIIDFSVENLEPLAALVIANDNENKSTR